MGAKVAALAHNPLWRGNRLGRGGGGGGVSEVVMGYRNGTYGRLRLGPNCLEVIDATEACIADGDYDLSLDWTEVLLGGNRADQDTVAAPYGTTLKVMPDWTHQIFINLAYPAVQEMVFAQLAETKVVLDFREEDARCVATESAEWALTKRISRATVYSLSKKSLGWRPEEVTRSQSTDSLSVIADDWAATMDMARARQQDQLAIAFSASLVPQSVAA
jgi:hypothetical protein